MQQNGVNTLKNKGKQRRSRETIGIIFDAATQVLIEHGYDRATTNRIAERSGFSVGTLYQYFDNKEDVYCELVKLELQRIVDATEKCEAEDSLQATMAELLNASNAALRRHPGETQALAPLLAGPFREYLDEAREKVVAAVKGLLQSHRQEVQLPDLEVAARVVVSAAEGFAVSASPDHFPSAELEHHMQRMLLSYLRST